MKKIKLLLVSGLIAATLNAAAQEIELKVPYGIGGSVKKSHQETKKVAIGSFAISQIVQNADATTAAGGAAFAKMTVNFGGVDMKAYQAVLQEGYDLAVKKLTSLGYEVLTPEQLKATGVETYVPTANPEVYKINRGTAQAISVQPAVTQVAMDLSPLGYNPLMKKAKELNANLLNFTLGATAVGFDRGSRFAKKAKISAAPWLTFGGSLTSYPIGKGGSPASISIAVKGGVDDFAGPQGIYETSKNTMPWLGSSKGKYVLDINQEKYLGYIRSFLIASVDQAISRWHQELTK